jgi:hypothetical protein
MTAAPKDHSMRQLAALAVVALISTSHPATAQMSHDQGHAMTSNAQGAIPTSPGQETFGAIAEIVAILRDNPATDWSRVDISTLRRHLLDMDDLVMRARADEEAIHGGLRIVIARNGPAGDAASRMVPAHAPVLRDETGWSSAVEVGDDTIVWTVTAASEQEAMQIRALGFFGLMATGAHHQPHHLAIARGELSH